MSANGTKHKMTPRAVSTAEGAITGASLTGLISAGVVWAQAAFPNQPPELWPFVAALVAFITGGGVARIIDGIRYPKKTTDFLDEFYKNGE